VRWKLPWRRVNQPSRWVVTVLASSVAVFALDWTGFFNIVGLDAWADRQYFDSLEYRGHNAWFSPLKLVYIDGEHDFRPDAQSETFKFSDAAQRERWRSLHASVLKAFESAGTHLVAFDMYWPEPAESNKTADTELAESIRQVSDSGVTDVVVGAASTQNSEMSASIQKVVRPEQYGSVAVGARTREVAGSAYYRRLVLGEANSRVLRLSVQKGAINVIPVTPTFPLRVLLAWYKTKPDQASAWLEANRRSLIILRHGDILRTIPCEAAQDADGSIRILYPLDIPEDLLLTNSSESYEQVYLRRGTIPEYKGGLVILGVRLKGSPESGGEEIQLSKTRKAFGYEVNASFVNQIIMGVYPHHLGALGEFVFLLGSCLIASFARRALSAAKLKVPLPHLGDREIPLGLMIMVLLYVLIAVILYEYRYLILQPSYDILALVVGYFVCGKRLLPRRTELLP
jgi:hypothetical protein